MRKKIEDKAPARKLTLPVPKVSHARLERHAQAVHVELMIQDAQAVLRDPEADPVRVREASALVERMHRCIRSGLPSAGAVRVEFMRFLEHYQGITFMVGGAALTDAEADRERGHSAWGSFVNVCPEYHRPIVTGEFIELLSEAARAWRENEGKARVDVARAIQSVFESHDDKKLKPGERRKIVESITRAIKAMRRERTCPPGE